MLKHRLIPTLEICNGLLFRSILRMCVQNLKFVALPIPEIIGGIAKKLGSPWIRPCSLFSQIFNGLLFAWALWIYLPNLKFVALPVPEIIGVLKKFGQSLDTPTLHFLSNFSWARVRMDPENVSAKFALRGFSRSWDNDCSFGVGLRTPILGNGRPKRIGDGTVRKSVCDFL